MCYNNKCKIEIESDIGGCLSAVSAVGKSTKTASGIRFDYALDGDECALIANDKEIVQTRRGEQNTKMIFRKGEQTECFLESGGFLGKFTVCTYDLKVSFGQVNIIVIVYSLGEEMIEIKFTAENN